MNYSRTPLRPFSPQLIPFCVMMCHIVICKMQNHNYSHATPIVIKNLSSPPSSVHKLNELRNGWIEFIRVALKNSHILFKVKETFIHQGHHVVLVNSVVLAHEKFLVIREHLLLVFPVLFHELILEIDASSIKI